MILAKDSTGAALVDRAYPWYLIGHTGHPQPTPGLRCNLLPQSGRAIVETFNPSIRTPDGKPWYVRWAPLPSGTYDEQTSLPCHP